MLAGPSNPHPEFEAQQDAPTEPETPAVKPKDKRQRVLLAVIAALALLLTACVAYQWGQGKRPEQQTQTAQPKASPSEKDSLTTAEIFQTLAPSVVFIESHEGAGHEASGTGVLVNADGTIMTAYHVVKDAKSIDVQFADGTKSPAKIASSDPDSDIATLTPQQLPQLVVPAVLGGGANVGDDVVAIGNQLSLIDSTTRGVVSGLDRTIDRKEGKPLKGLIQFDAAVNPGSSGGPLVNNQGQTIGIVVALANPTDAGTFIGVGFAVPIGSAVGGGRPPLV